MDGQYSDSTRSINSVASEPIPGHAVVPSPVPASTFHLSRDESDSKDTYARGSNPTRHQLDSALAQLEGASAALTFGSGMAAVTSVLRALVKPGSKLVVPADGYYQVRDYASEYLVRQGVTVDIATADQMCAASVDADVVLAESPTNPGLDVVDLHQLAMQCRSRGATLIVDNTTATPFGQQPLSLGADVVVASATKALSGHGDLLAGYVVSAHTHLMDAVARERLRSGAILGVFEGWLLLRSLGTAGLRFERQCHNAAALAVALHAHPAVRAVRYPGLPDDPSHRIACVQMKRFGGLIAVELGDAAAVHNLVERSALLIAATSFGGIHSSVDRRARWGDDVSDGFARISLGIEDTDDLIADIEQALG